ncbi:hypothetical protein OCT51_17670 [Halomonas sp. LR3S48]|uniref:hypothetical protein n=1 Tax=Halomonas sp. LR3S48 TaxID=2982694 RepID=UPI0021E4967C|nr:hypothetical protein [Halomonas sp. LR3S48]UYG03002.1 hypothetical protein OCT51_17670 [Halomonas sp. LR3S48]
MPLPGGPSDKYGNRFEGKWTAYCIAQVMAEEADFIRLEPLGAEGDGTEFSLHKGEVIEYHQVKRQHARPGDWSIRELGEKNVLRHAFLKTRDPNCRYHFVSTTSAGILATLIDDARRAESLAEFREHFFKGHKVKAWADIRGEWYDLIQEEADRDSTASAEDLESVHERIAYEHLKRICIRTLDEETLTEMVETKLRTLVRSDPATVRHTLCDMVLENIHATLYADGFWSYVEGLGHKRVDYASDASVLAALDELNARYTSMIKGIGSGITLPREEVAKVMDIMKGDGRKTSALVSGEAGIGKTCVLGQAIHQLRLEGTPHLYFRVDRLEPTDLPSNVSSQLGLPSTPAEVLAGVARGRRCVLIVDQLDAVSLVSGRNPEFFHCVHEIICQAAAFPNMSLLLACRRFDIEKDSRLRELISEDGLAQEVSVKSFTPEGVMGVFEQLGCRSSDYSDRQIELLRLPLHLALFAEVIQAFKDAPFAFATSVELFSAYWELKREAVSSRAGPGENHWTSVLDSLCDKMTERQTLFAPEAAVLDDYHRTVRAMESENVLVLDRGRVGFFHEGFFDYVFARRFATRGGDLIQYLKEGEQGLFKRAPLRQILLHTHAMDHVGFVRELRRVILDPSIRFHLRRCALEVASKIECATPELWQLFQDVFASGNPSLIREVWRALWVASPWFPFLQEKGLIASWLASDDSDERGRALTMVRNHIQTFPGECVDLLSHYVGVSDKWNADILHIIWHRVLSTDRRIFDLFMRMHAVGAIADERCQDFWMCMHDLPKNRPDWAAEALSQYLRLALVNTCVEDIKRDFFPSGNSGERLILEIAEKAPAIFLTQVLPVFLEVVQNAALDRDGKLTMDRVWYFRGYREECSSIEDSLLKGIVDSLRTLAKSSVADYARYIDQLRPYGDYDSVNFVIVRALSNAPPEFSDSTVEYLLANPQRFECGWSWGGEGDFTYWAARELVEHVATHCSDDAFALLESVMTDYFPHGEKTIYGFRSRGYWQLVMLPALPVGRRGHRTEVRLGEWHRKFPKMKIEPPIASKVGWVGSPIKAEAVPWMKDADWLKALQAYDTDEGSRRRPHSFLEGGAHQLSGVLESEIKRDPIRFARLSERFPDNTHGYYYHALLRGLKESDADQDTVLTVVRRVFALPEKPGHRYLCDAIAKFSADDLPEDILAIVGWCATESDDPKSEDLTVRSSGSEEENRPHDILTTAINSIRGAAAEMVGALLLDKAARVPFFIPYLEKMVHDPTVIVRTTVAHSLLGLYKHDEARAVDLFLALVDTDNDYLLATHHVDRFLHYANVRHFQRLRLVLRRMLNSPLSAVREAGARHVCLAQFSNPEAADMVAGCVTGDEAQRKGAVKVAEANLFNPVCAAFTHRELPVFFNDPVREIRDTAARCFRKAEGRDLEKAKPIIRTFLDSNAFRDNVDDLMWPLEHSTADIAEEILLTCEAVIANMESLGDDPVHRLYRHANSVAELVLRAYRQTNEAAVRTRCLNIIDLLLAQEVYGISKELEEFER